MADIFSQDSREKLEAEMLDDIEHFVNGEWVVTHETIADWLDRQAAITERTAVIAAKEAGKVLREKIAELQAKMDELESLDDGLLDKYLERGEKIAELTEERDLWNKRYSQSYDYALDLQAQLDKLSSDELHWRSEAEFWRCKYELIAKAVNDVARNYVDSRDEGMA